MAYNFYSNCVNWPGKVADLSQMIDNNIDITRRTFLQYVNREELAEIERDLSYEKHPSQGLTMAGDYHVSYHRSKLRGKRVYYFRHSAIEYVFTGGKNQ
jgi:hypothetical protein